MPLTAALGAAVATPPASGAELLVSFCLRLALGLAACLVVLPAAEVAPRFYRTQFLVILGLATTAGFFLVGLLREAGWVSETLVLGLAVGMGALAAYLGSVVYSLEGAPGGRILIGLAILALLLAVVRLDWRGGWLDGLTSAALLGTAMSAMLMGHSYLIAPSMSMTPLRRLLVGLFVALALRCVLEAWLAIGWWNTLGAHDSPTASSQFTGILMLVRLGVGIFGVLFLGWLAWRCAAIRSTQSATGILYVVVILAFFGELISLVLHTGYLV